jgi:hypothetical protein
MTIFSKTRVIGNSQAVTSFIHYYPHTVFISRWFIGSQKTHLNKSPCLFQLQDLMSTSSTMKSWHMTVTMCTEVTFEHGVLSRETTLSTCGSVLMVAHSISDSRGTYPHSAITWLLLAQLARQRILSHHTFITAT